MASTSPKSFAAPGDFRRWLERYHQSESELVVRISKAGFKGPGVRYAEALDEALCFGWIDGVRRRLDAQAFSIRFSPRNSRSIWSRVNVAHAERLIREGRMHASGRKVFEARTPGRTGIYSFEQLPVNLDPAFVVRLKASTAGWTHWNDEAPWYRRTASFWVMSAKGMQTRERRFLALLECCEQGLRVAPLRKPTPGRKL